MEIRNEQGVALCDGFQCRWDLWPEKETVARYLVFSHFVRKDEIELNPAVRIKVFETILPDGTLLTDVAYAHTHMEKSDLVDMVKELRTAAMCIFTANPGAEMTRSQGGAS